MNKKKLLIYILVLVNLFICTSCNKEEKKVVTKVIGNSIVVNSIENMPYRIEELDIISNGNVMLIENYTYDDYGENYNIKDSKNKVIGKVKLSPKTKIYKEKSLEINIDSYDYDNIIISNDVGTVEIIGKENMTSQYMFICIEERDTPLDIYLKNVNIKTHYMMPVIYSCSAVDINIIVEGNNIIKAGNEILTQEEINYLLDTATDVVDVLYPMYKVYSISKKGLKKSIINGVVQGVKGGYDAGINSFIDSYYDKMITNQEITIQWWNKVSGLIAGDNGSNGIDGCSAIESLGNICIIGDGKIQIIGGNGTAGTNAKIGLLNTTGGKGGNGGSAIFCYNAAILISDNCDLIPGEGGKGGYGYQRNERVKANDGKMGTDITAQYRFMYNI